MQKFDFKEKQLSTEMIFQGRILNLRVDQVELPNKEKGLREVVEHPGAVAIVPVLEDGSIIMVLHGLHQPEQILKVIQDNMQEQVLSVLLADMQLHLMPVLQIQSQVLQLGMVLLEQQLTN